MAPGETMLDIVDVRAELLAELSTSRTEAVLARLLTRAGKGARRVKVPRAPKPCEPSPEALARAHALLKRRGLT